MITTKSLERKVISCGPGKDTITDFNEAEGDTRTAQIVRTSKEKNK